MALFRCRSTRMVLVALGLATAAIMTLGWWWRLLGASRPFPGRDPVFLEATGHSQAPQLYRSTHTRLQTHPDTAVPADRFWHLDLKGGAPRVEVLESLMVLAARAGATGVLVEWEDAFPYTGALANLSAHTAYTMQEVHRIAEAAKGAGLTLVHLMQSLGHLEYALKLPQWAELREGESPAEACPSRPATARLVTDAIDQLMSAMPSSLVHIGADEVFTLGQCSRCRARDMTPLNLYLHHVLHVAKHVRTRWGVRVLMWDDMVRRAPVQALRALAGVAEPVVWAYGPDVTRMVPAYILRTYAAIFPKVWLAPAFKGATGPRAIMPDAARHAANTLAWVQVAQRMQHARLNVAGLIITGWSRYDHFSVLCELLPPSTPSLVLTLLTASRGSLTPASLQDAHALLDCPPHVMLNPAQDRHLWATRDCAFPGANVAALLHRFARLRDDVKDMHHEAEEKGGWLTPYNLRYNFSSPARVREATMSLRSLSSSLKEMYEEARAVLSQYHDTHTTKEWTEQHLDPLNTTLTSLRRAATTLLSFTVWPRRPLDLTRPNQLTKTLRNHSHSSLTL
ncbi:hexosaminidase D-like [Scylla paramamosain]|uniref:hexosaminidase D-like n=1 Tax=Scylla paramamosain TaxID=85552 RepID=UPI0030826C96